MEINDSYNTIAKPSNEVLFKDRGSKFFGYAFPIDTVEDAKTALDLLKNKHPNAGHFCYAYELGFDNNIYRYSDDGEPSNSAGAPIYGQLQSFKLTNVLVVVLRYFGGTKLGVGGLRNAYKIAAKRALEESTIIEKTITQLYTIEFNYDLMNVVMRLAKELGVTIINQQMNATCVLKFAVRLSETEKVENRFTKLHKAIFKKLVP